MTLRFVCIKSAINVSGPSGSPNEGRKNLSAIRSGISSNHYSITLLHNFPCCCIAANVQKIMTPVCGMDCWPLFFLVSVHGEHATTIELVINSQSYLHRIITFGGFGPSLIMLLTWYMYTRVQCSSSNVFLSWSVEDSLWWIGRPTLH